MESGPGVFVVVRGICGSGKSDLIEDLLPRLWDEGIDCQSTTMNDYWEMRDMEFDVEFLSSAISWTKHQVRQDVKANRDIIFLDNMSLEREHFEGHLGRSF